jgi:hypothetical protein
VPALDQDKDGLLKASDMRLMMDGISGKRFNRIFKRLDKRGVGALRCAHQYSVLTRLMEIVGQS